MDSLVYLISMRQKQRLQDNCTWKQTEEQLRFETHDKNGKDMTHNEDCDYDIEPKKEKI